MTVYELSPVVFTPGANAGFGHVEVIHEEPDEDAIVKYAMYKRVVDGRAAWVADYPSIEHLVSGVFVLFPGLTPGMRAEIRRKLSRWETVRIEHGKFQIL